MSKVPVKLSISRYFFLTDCNKWHFGVREGSLLLIWTTGFHHITANRGKGSKRGAFIRVGAGAIASRGCGGSRMVGKYHLLPEVLSFFSPYVELVGVGKTKLRVKHTIDGCRATRGQHTQDLWTVSCHFKRLLRLFGDFLFVKFALNFCIWY